jgi:hypothetical protein
MAGPLRFIAWGQVRRRWRACVALAVFIGLIGGLSISLIAGSRRSASVVARYLAAGRHYDLGLYLEKADDQGQPVLTTAQLTAIPGVERADLNTYVAMTARTAGGRTDGVNALALDPTVPDPTTRIIDGEIPDGSNPFEAVVNEDFVKEFGRSTGDTIRVQMFGPDQFGEVQAGKYKPGGPHFRFHITGVMQSPATFSSDERHQLAGSTYSDTNVMVVPQKFYEEHRRDFLDFGPNYGIVLKDGSAGSDRFSAAVRRLLPAGATVQIGPATERTHQSSLSTPVDLETSALLALGISLAAIGAIAAGLVLRAEQRIHDEDTPTLKGLGCTAPQLSLVGAYRTLPIAFGAAILAVGVAVALSGRYPIGIGRQLELDPGIEANVAVLAVGALAILVLTVGAGSLLGRPVRLRRALPTSRLTFARWLGRTGAPVNLTLGTQLTFERGRGVRSVPARAAILGGAVAFAVVTALSIYVAGTDRLYAAPAAHGWPWDAVVGNTNFELSGATVRNAERDPQLRHVTAARAGSVRVNGQSTDVLAFDPRGDAPPEILAGRLPETASEIALGTGTMDKLGIDIGDTVTMSVGHGEFEKDGSDPVPVKLRVVGKTLVASIGGDFDFGFVGVVTLGAIKAAGGNARPQIVLANLRTGPVSAGYSAMDKRYQEDIATDSIPARVVNLHRIRRLPLIGLLLAGLMGTLLLIYTLAISARARAGELAVLRAIGMSAKGLRRVLVWQGALLGAGIVIIGLPAGVALGSAVWNQVADDLGVVDALTISPLIWLLVPLALLVAVVAALYPARRARRQPVAELLRVE